MSSWSQRPVCRKTRTWACELASPNELARRGSHSVVTEDRDVVCVIGTRAKDGSFKIHTDTLTMDNSSPLQQVEREESV